MISAHEALELVLQRAIPLGEVSRRLPEALGHCLAEDVRADRHMPPADRSAMDGYAVRSADPSELRPPGEVPAGARPDAAVDAGTCVRVLTGADMLGQGEDGPRAVPVESHSSADLVAAGRADGTIAVPADVRHVEAGCLVEFHPWGPLP